MKVTVISSLPPQKGITPYTGHLLDALAQHPGVDVDALGFSTLYPRFAYPGGSPENPAPPRASSVPTRKLMSWYNPLSWLHAGVAMRGDVVHAQWWSWALAAPYCAALSIAKRRGKRVVVTVHNVQPHEASGLKARLNRMVMRLADHLIVHSEQNKTALVAQGFAPEGVSVIPMGVHAIPQPEVAALHPRADARSALGLPDDARVALFFGNLRPYKGIDVLIAAAAMARDNVPGLRVLIAGELWKDCPDPRLQIAEAGLDATVTARVGFVPDAEIRALFDACDVVVFPYTHFDGQSAAAALALSSGKALIVSDTGGLPELVRDARAVVPPLDAGALASALTAVLTDDALRAKLEADTAAIRATLSWSSIAAATVECYERVLGVDTARELRPAAAAIDAADAREAA